MAKPVENKEIITIQELAITKILEIETLITLLMEEGIITRDELMGKIEKMRAKMGR